MPRPPKCAVPRGKGFVPLEGGTEEQIVMTVEEYETIRLISLEGCTQEQCARQMQIARTTVQSIYGSAKTKMADALVNGKTLTVSGGSYCRGRCCGWEGGSCGKGEQT